jgi:hypothetical protein
MILCVRGVRYTLPVVVAVVRFLGKWATVVLMNCEVKMREMFGSGGSELRSC